MSSAIPEGSIVLVTGVNGYIGSHTADQLLSFGYKVRGTVRDASRCQWVQKFFDEKYGKGRLELVLVSQTSADGAFDEAVKGVSGIVHVASDVSFSPDPNAVIPQTIASTVGILNSANKESTVKRVVYTSSSSAASSTIPNKPFEVTVDSWNDEASKIAWAPPPYTPDRAFAVYAASKLKSEKACWKFMAEEKPAFEFNAVLPSGNFGPALGEGQSSPSFIAIRTLIQGDLETARKYGVAPQYFVDVRDTARFHVIALTNPAVKSERILAYAEPYNWSKILDILRKAYPTRKWPDNIPDEPKDLCTLTEARSRAIELLKELGRKDFITLEESINDCAHIMLGSA
ncbi:NAD-P-binding protein [Stereum hirsutum FP-91666 SS1]|uniref:NAD-P-binding protein n=1 Tax=Stereum hirsutum (strain FP-91666) TaxID=721885 RepID=UPI000444A4F3|nr:NAD-P-binding protein [Stereum hirsutum FP-91666 SS1]EIM82969.1 NAD-P-binding protein [Stereum hirsutum FP-91666 SS1]